MITDTIVFKEMLVFPELFLGISVVYLILYGAFLVVNCSFPLIQTPTLHLSILIILMICFLLVNEDLSVCEFSIFNNSIINDYASTSSKILISCFCIVCLLMTECYLQDQKVNQFEYFLLFLFAILGFFLLCSANDLITAYLAIELQSLSFYVLASFKKNSSFSVDAGLKYFILGAFSSSLFLLGVSIIYGFTGTLNFEDFKDLFFCNFPGNSTKFSVDNFYIKHHYLILTLLEMTSDDAFLIFNQYITENLWNDAETLISEVEAYTTYIHNNLELWSFYSKPLATDLLPFAIIFIIVSLFFKLALAPFHLWAPDIYEGSLSSSTFFFAVMPKLGIFLLLIRLFYCCFYGFLENWRYFVVSIALISIVVGSTVGLEQRKLKNLLAYSSISQMGYSLMAFSTGTFEGIQFLFCYLIVYMCSGTCLWSIFLLTRLKYKFVKKQNKDITDFVLLKKSNKMLALFLTILLFSIAGFPPMIGFLVKIGVFLVSLEASMFCVAFLAILFSVIATFYYIRIIKLIFFENKLVGKLYQPISVERAFIIVFLVYLLIFLFINPTLLFLISYKISMVFF